MRYQRSPNSKFRANIPRQDYRPKPELLHHYTKLSLDKTIDSDLLHHYVCSGSEQPRTKSYLFPPHVAPTPPKRSSQRHPNDLQVI